MGFPIRPAIRALTPPLLQGKIPVAGAGAQLRPLASARFAAICGVGSPRSIFERESPPSTIQSQPNNPAAGGVEQLSAPPLRTQIAGGPPSPPQAMGRAEEFRLFNNQEHLRTFARERDLQIGESAAGIFLIAQNGWIQGRIEPTDNAQPLLAEFVILVDHEGRMIHSSALDTMSVAVCSALSELFINFEGEGSEGTNSALGENGSFAQLYRERLGRLGNFERHLFPELIPDYRGLSPHARALDSQNSRLIAEQRRTHRPFHPLQDKLCYLALYITPTGELTTSDEFTPIEFIVDINDQVIRSYSEVPALLTIYQQLALQRLTNRSALRSAQHCNPLELD